MVLLPTTASCQKNFLGVADGSLEPNGRYSGEKRPLDGHRQASINIHLAVNIKN